MKKYIDFDLENIYNCHYFNNTLNELGDIKIKVEDKEIYASKYILFINSMYFKSMLQTDMLENKYNKIMSFDLNGFEYDSVINVLYYIYTKKIYYSSNEILTEKIFNMYEVADYLQIKELTSKIILFLINEININNFNKIYIFSNKYDLIKLKEAVIDYICVNSKDIIDTKNFYEIIDISDKEIIYDLMKKIILS